MPLRGLGEICVNQLAQLHVVHYQNNRQHLHTKVGAVNNAMHTYRKRRHRKRRQFLLDDGGYSHSGAHEHHSFMGSNGNQSTKAQETEIEIME